jgi:hypothetical protein
MKRADQKVVVGIIKDHINGFFFEDDLFQLDYVFVADFTVKLIMIRITTKLHCSVYTYCNLSYRTLTYTSVSLSITLFLSLELFDSVYLAV